jgi:hypothetical protein
MPVKLASTTGKPQTIRAVHANAGVRTTYQRRLTRSYNGSHPTISRLST